MNNYFYYTTFNVFHKVYACNISGENIPRTLTKEFFNGNHLDGNSNDEVSCVSALLRSFPNDKIPLGIGDVFTNLKWLKLNHCVNKICADDLKQFPHLGFLDLSDNKIEKLPGNLFQHNKEIFWINLSFNKIKEVPPSVLNGLVKLRIFLLDKNENYDLRYHQSSNSLSLQEFKDEIARKWKEIQKAKQYSEPQPSTSGMQIEIGEAQKRCNMKRHEDVDNFLLFDEFKDFNVKVGERNFKVHKFLMIARCPTIAEIMRNNPNVDELNLNDTTAEIFDIILNYIYKDEIPKNSTNALEIFTAAAKLKMDDLKEATAEILIKNLMENHDLNYAGEVLMISYKADCQKLKMKAIEVYNRNLDEAYNKQLALNAT